MAEKVFKKVCYKIKSRYMYIGTPVTRPTMGPISNGRVTGVVASVKLKI
jgi:hypothetical protein